MECIELVEKSKQGDGSSFSKLIRLHEKDLYRVAIAMLKNDDDALDCIQDTILTAFKNLKNLMQDEYFRTWLLKILMNKCNDSLNRKKKVVPYAEVQSDVEYHDNTEKLEIRTAVDSLENELKILVVLYYYEDMSVKDIGESLRIPEGTVKSRLSRARGKLKELLEFNERGVI